MISWALAAAPNPTTAAAGRLIKDSPAAPNPKTVAGPTNGPATAFATRPDALTRPEIAATSGSVLRFAARGTATDSAMTIGSQRLRITAHGRAHQMIPALAMTERPNRKGVMSRWR